MTSTEVKLPVKHVSDTAYLVALYRAYETERKDAIFIDPFAKMLADPKKRQLEKLIPLREEGSWLMSVRTAVLDRHILQLVADGVDTVMNLAAGLDTRPYRLDLPENLLWIEADFPGITDYKTEKLSREKPQCQLERFALDLMDDIARRQLLSYLGAKSRRTLIITEGLLPYLPESAVRSLAMDLRSQPGVTHWLMDIATTKFLERIKKQWKEEEEVASKVALRFAPENGALYFEKLCWKVLALDSFLEAGERLGRKAPGAFTEDAEALLAGDNSGVALLRRM